MGEREESVEVNEVEVAELLAEGDEERRASEEDEEEVSVDEKGLMCSSDCCIRRTSRGISASSSKSNSSSLCLPPPLPPLPLPLPRLPLLSLSNDRDAGLAPFVALLGHACPARLPPPLGVGAGDACNELLRPRPPAAAVALAGLVRVAVRLGWRLAECGCGGWSRSLLGDDDCGRSLCEWRRGRGVECVEERESRTWLGVRGEAGR